MPPYNGESADCRARSPSFAEPSERRPNRAFYLRRLQHIWFRRPIYFLTVCVADRRHILVQAPAANLLVQSLHDASRIHGWSVGRFVIMPDHVHFFCGALADAKELPVFIRDWKRWTARKAEKLTGIPSPLWQREFFDHVLRSRHSHEAKWRYVRENPVRAGLVANAGDWPYQGECESLQF
jgi:REP element-mobilizing transposase RayT